MSHPYHPHCGCATCCKVERADELDQLQAGSDIAALTRSPAFISEQALDGADADKVADAIRTGDHAEIGRIFQEAVERAARWHVSDYAKRHRCTPAEAAVSLLCLYPGTKP